LRQVPRERRAARQSPLSFGWAGFLLPSRNTRPRHYIAGMSKFEFCIPTVGKAVPTGPEWFHEIKYDGYRLRLERDGDRVRLFTKGGHDWTKRYPWIVESALRMRPKRFVLDGEAVVRGVDGYSDFNALQSGKHNAEVEMLAFDILALGGRRPPGPASIDAKDKPSAVVVPPAGRHLHVRP
jgi:ATP-dependent DNA ligase